MNRFLFTLKNTFHSLAVKRGFNLIIIIALSIGLFLPMLFLARGNYELNFFSKPLYQNTKATAYVDGTTKLKTTEKLDKILASIKGVTNFAYTASIEASVEKGDSSFLSRAAGVSQNFFNLKNVTLVEGRLPTPEEIKNGDHVCVVRLSSAFTDGWIMKPGDKFILNGEEFTLTGIIIDPTTYGNFMIPYPVLEQMVRPNMDLQYVIVSQTTEDNVEYVLDYTKDLGFITNIIVSCSAAEHEAEVHRQVWIGMSKSLVRDVILLCFAVLNFVLIIYGKFVESLYTWGVKIALGQTKGAIFLELFLQNLILILLAAIAPAIVICTVLPNIMVITILTNLVWFVSVALLCVAIALIVTVVLYLVLMRKKVPDMLKIK